METDPFAPEPEPLPTVPGMEPGDPFDEQAPPKPPPADTGAAMTDPDELVVEPWSLAKTKRKLRELSTAAHNVAGDRVHANLVMTPEEIEGMAPFLTSFLNRNTMVRRAAEHSEFLSFLLASYGYGGRVWSERQAFIWMAENGMIGPDGRPLAGPPMPRPEPPAPSDDAPDLSSVAPS